MEQDSKTIRVHQATQVRLSTLAKELGMSVTNLASSMLETQINQIYETGSISLIVKKMPNSSAKLQLKNK